jgi:5-methylcytosine-specific restriction endonuclease McrA
LSAARSDRTFEIKHHDGESILEGKCIHCQTKLAIRLDGAPIGDATLEHIVPRNHGGTDALENLAVACGRCNAEKGLRHDHKRPDDPRARRVIERLQAKRKARFRTPN